jgi:hypothetical protein
MGRDGTAFAPTLISLAFRRMALFCHFFTADPFLNTFTASSKT